MKMAMLYHNKINETSFDTRGVSYISVGIIVYDTSKTLELVRIT